MNQKERAVFLDLQGTLGGQGLEDVRSLEFYPCAIEAIRMINASDFLAVVITNQSHIGRGHFSFEEYERRIGELRQGLQQQGAYLDAVYCCPHIASDGCNCKKPLTGMVDRAAQDLSIDVSRSYVVGDMGATDMNLAANVGALGILVLTGVGKGSLGEFRSTWSDIEPAAVVDDVLAAMEWILEQEPSQRNFE